MKLKDLVPDVWVGEPMEIPNIYDPKAVAKAVSTTQVKPKTVYVKNTATGQIVGKRTIMSK